MPNVQRITQTLAVVSLLLCIAALFGWGRSYLQGNVIIGSVRGSLGLACVEAGDEFLRNTLGGDDGDHVIRVLDSMGFVADHRLAGFAYVAGNFNGANFWIVQVPYWLIVLLTAILPTFVFFQRHRRLARDRGGRCLGCGYDLRATPGRCPECGREPEVPRAPAAGPSFETT